MLLPRNKIAPSCVHRTLDKMQHCTQMVFPGCAPVIKKGHIEPIDISVASRGSNKKVCSVPLFLVVCILTVFHNLPLVSLPSLCSLAIGHYDKEPGAVWSGPHSCVHSLAAQGPGQLSSEPYPWFQGQSCSPDPGQPGPACRKTAARWANF